MTARLLPHRGYIHVEHEFFKKTWWGHHVGVQERRLLPSPGPVLPGQPLPSWTVKYDEEDFAVFVSSSGEEIEVDDFFEKALYVNDADSGRLSIVDQNNVQEDWVGLRLPHNKKIAVLPIGAARAKVELHMAVFNIRKNTCRCFFSLGDIHAALGYQARGRRRPSRWVHRRIPAWENLMNRLSVSGSYVKSMPYKQRQPVVIEAPASAKRWPS